MKKYAGNLSLHNAMIMGIDPEKFEVKVCYVSGKPDGTNLLDRNKLSIYMDIDNPDKSKFRTVMSLAKLIRSEKPDILHCHRHKTTVYGVMASLMAKNPLKIISHVHGMNRSRSAGRKITNLLMSRFISQFLSVSEAVKKDIIKNNLSLDSSRITTVRNGINLEKIDNTATVDPISAKKLLDLSPDAFVYGTVGRLVKTKGHSYLIDAFADIAGKIPNSRLVLVGDGPLKSELSKKADDLGLAAKVLLCGFRKDALQLLKGFDVFVFPSLAEGLPLALLEAMASGLPVIASKAGGIPEVLDDGRCGILVPPGNSQTLAEAMQTMYSLSPGQRNKMGNDAQKRVEDAFTEELMCKGLGSIYETIMNSA